MFENWACCRCTHRACPARGLNDSENSWLSSRRVAGGGLKEAAATCCCPTIWARPLFSTSHTQLWIQRAPVNHFLAFLDCSVHLIFPSFVFRRKRTSYVPRWENFLSLFDNRYRFGFVSETWMPLSCPYPSWFEVSRVLDFGDQSAWRWVLDEPSSTICAPSGCPRGLVQEHSRQLACRPVPNPPLAAAPADSRRRDVTNRCRMRHCRGSPAILLPSASAARRWHRAPLAQGHRSLPPASLPRGESLPSASCRGRWTHCRKQAGLHCAGVKMTWRLWVPAWFLMRQSASRSAM